MIPSNALSCHSYWLLIGYYRIKFEHELRGEHFNYLGLGNVDLRSAE